MSLGNVLINLLPIIKKKKPSANSRLHLKIDTKTTCTTIIYRSILIVSKARMSPKEILNRKTTILIEKKEPTISSQEVLKKMKGQTL
jgi:hypothetical protein